MIALFFVAVILFILCLPVAIFYLVFDTVASLFFRIAVVIDMAGNVLGEEIFNDLLITTDGYKFGNRKETISSVLGKNQQKETLTKAGKSLVWILDSIEKDHCILSIDNMV